MSTLQHFVSQQVSRTPSNTAIELQDDRISYAGLELRADHIARLLVERGARPGDRVALMQKRSFDAVASVLGALKCGTVYVPIDSGHPAARIEAMLADCQPRFVLLDDRTASRWSTLNKDHTQSVTTLVTNEICAPASGPDLHSTATEPDSVHACILYTSGSTGAPKGVAVRQESILEFTRWAQRRFELTKSSRVAGQTPFHFDLSLFDLFATLGSGATLVLVPDHLQLLPEQLLKHLERRAITHLLCVPSLLSSIATAQSFKHRPLGELRWLLSCGEVLTASTANKWLSAHAGLQLANLYGPTETTIASTCQVLSAPPRVDAAVPIGSACPGEQVIIVDDAGSPMDAGEIGEICIAGVGLAKGYWNNPTESRRKFCALSNSQEGLWYKTGDLGRLEAGLLYFHGRKDQQIKFRGYRIELGEIEAAAGRFEALDACCVIAISDAANNPTAIACAYTVTASEEVSREFIEQQFRQHLLDLLPRYMVPGRFKEFQSLPRTSNGKIDRQALQRSFAANG